MSFTRFFTTPSLLRRMSDDKLREFSDDNLERIRAMNTDGRYNQMSADTQSAMQAFSDAINFEDGLYARQQMMTKKVDSLTRKFKFAVQDFAGQVRNVFGRDSAEYECFFPNGLREYSKVNRKTAGKLMNRILLAFTSFNNLFGAGPQQTFDLIRNDFLMLRQQQKEKIAQVAAAKQVTAERRRTLELRIYQNACDIGIEFNGQPEVMGSFFSLSMMTNRQSVANGIIEGQVPPGSIDTLISEGIGPDTELQLTNRGQTELVFALSDDPSTLNEAYGISLMPGSKFVLTAAALGPETNKYLNVKNLSTGAIGEFEVEVLSG